MELDYTTYELNKDPFQEEKATKILKVLHERVTQNNINLQALVAEYDKDNKGGLTQEQFGCLVGTIDPKISEKEKEYMFLKLDSDRSGLVEAIEIEEGILEATEGDSMTAYSLEKKQSIDDKTKKMVEYLKHIIQTNGLNLKKIFRRFDKHKRKALDLTEFTQIMQIIDETIAQEEVLHVFRKVDYNDDRLISYEEFYNFMK